MPRLTREALHKMREDAKKGVYLREGNFHGKIIVHMGTCGIVAGARDVLAALMSARQKSGRTDIAITTSGCAGVCSMEPMITVQISDTAPVRYGKLDADKARKVFEQHVVGGQILAEYAFGVGSERAG